MWSSFASNMASVLSRYMYSSNRHWKSNIIDETIFSNRLYQLFIISSSEIVVSKWFIQRLQWRAEFERLVRSLDRRERDEYPVQRKLRCQREGRYFVIKDNHSLNHVLKARYIQRSEFRFRHSSLLRFRCVNMAMSASRVWLSKFEMWSNLLLRLSSPFLQCKFVRFWKCITIWITNLIEQFDVVVKMTLHCRQDDSAVSSRWPFMLSSRWLVGEITAIHCIYRVLYVESINKIIILN